MRLLNIVLSFIILIGCSILGTILPYREGNSLWTIISILWLFIEPTKFFIRKNYRRVTSSWYFYVLGIFECIILFFMFYRTELSFWIIYISIFILYLLHFFTKRERYIRGFDISKLLLLMIGIISFGIYFNQNNLSLFQAPIGVSLSIFSILLIFLLDRTSKEQNLKLIYVILMGFSIVVRQPICFVLLIRLFLDLDFF